MFLVTGSILRMELNEITNSLDFALINRDLFGDDYPMQFGYRDVLTSSDAEYQLAFDLGQENDCIELLKFREITVPNI